LNRVNWSADSLEISGWAMLRHIDLNETDAPKVALYWQSLDGKHRLDFHLHPAHDFVSRRYGSKWPDYDAAAFHATLDSAKLAAFASAHGELELRATLDSVGRHREFSVSRIFSGGTAVLLRSAVTQDGT